MKEEYIDFDSLHIINGHIGKDITIPEKILLGCVTLRSRNKGGKHTYLSVANMIDSDYDKYKKSFEFRFNNDCIVISSSGVIVDIFSRYKDKILSHKEILDVVKTHFARYLLSVISSCEQATDEDFSYYFDVTRCVYNLKNEGIPRLYDIKVFQLVIQSINVLSLPQSSTIHRADTRIARDDRPISTCKLFLLGCNNGNYNSIEAIERNDLSWTKGEKLYHGQKVSSELEKVEVDQVMVEKLSLK